MAKVRDIEDEMDGEDMTRQERRSARRSNKQIRKQDAHEAGEAQRRERQIDEYLASDGRSDYTIIDNRVVFF